MASGDHSAAVKLARQEFSLRGGLATVAHEIARSPIPVSDSVQSVSELLGFDPVYLACEGRHDGEGRLPRQANESKWRYPNCCPVRYALPTRERPSLIATQPMCSFCSSCWVAYGPENANEVPSWADERLLRQIRGHSRSYVSLTALSKKPSSP